MRSVLDYARAEGSCVEDKDEDKTAGYVLKLPGVKGEVYVLGPYDVPTGGCDTSHSAIEVFDILPILEPQFHHLLYEGLFVMNMTRGPALAEQYGRDLCILQLTTPLAICISSINSRRAERGAGALTKTKNTQDNYKRATNFCAKMRDAGARVVRVEREEGLETLLKILKEG